MSDLLSASQTREAIADLARLIPNALTPKMDLPADLPASLRPAEDQRTKWDPVFTGGGVVCLLITDPAAPPPSKTKDIDIVLEVTSYAEFIGLEIPLHRAGFTQPGLEGDAPFITWRRQGIRIDIMPCEAKGWMPTNRWFPYLIEEAERVEILPGSFAWQASAPCFLATKFEAFFSRGGGDFMSSKDIEDILAVVDGRVELIGELANCAYDVRGFVSRCCGDLLDNGRFMDCLPRLVPDDDREIVTARRLRQIAQLL